MFHALNMYQAHIREVNEEIGKIYMDEGILIKLKEKIRKLEMLVPCNEYLSDDNI